MADNMLIDGLIKFCDEKSKNIKLKAEPQVFVEIKQALEELKVLKEKNTPKRPFGIKDWTCPTCGAYHSTREKFCSECRQVILWD